NRGSCLLASSVFAPSRTRHSPAVSFSEERLAMKKVVAGVFAFSLVFLATGCGDSPDSIKKDTIQLMNDQAEIFEKINSKEDVEKYKGDLEKIGKRAKEIEERGKKLKIEEMPKEKLEALNKKYEGETTKAFTRLGTAMQKAAPYLVGDLFKNMSKLGK